MSPEKLAAAHTTAVWTIFQDLEEIDLKILLHEAGIVIPYRRKEQIAAAVTHWYRGSVPNFETLDELIK